MLAEQSFYRIVKLMTAYCQQCLSLASAFGQDCVFLLLEIWIKDLFFSDFTGISIKNRCSGGLLMGGIEGEYGFSVGAQEFMRGRHS